MNQATRRTLSPEGRARVILARMKTNDAGRSLIRTHEGLRLTAYRDPAGILTIGYGHTTTVRPGQRITQAEAEALLEADLAAAEQAVLSAVTVPLSDNAFAALVSLVFNIGTGAFRRSTLRRRLNAGDWLGAADAFLMWDKATVRGRKTRLAGLARRRAEERALFLTPDD